MAELIYLPVARLHPHPDNPRKNLGDLTEMVDSIKANGILQNLTVVVDEPTSTISNFTVIIGHRRLAAAKLAGLEKVPCVIADMTPKEQAKTMLMENIQRSDLTVYEQAQGFQLMLDMGETVESIANESGFSRTTVRNRLEIAKLDPEKLRKAQSRQATLQDYIDLSKIEDIEVRNALLDVIGTVNFRNRLKQALENQNDARRLKKWEETVATFAQRVETADYSKREVGCILDGGIRAKYVRNFSTWLMKKDEEIKAPEDAGSVRYFYKMGSGQIDLYRELTEEDIRKEQDLDQRKQAIREESDRRSVALEAMRDRHYKLRRDFVRNFKAVKSRIGQIIPMASVALIGFVDSSGRINAQHAAEVMGLKVPKKIGGGNDLFDWFKREFEKRLTERPEQTLLLIAYARLDSPELSYYTSRWREPAYHYIHRTNSRLSQVYDLLSALGYEMSDEERAMREGTHELLEKLEDVKGKEAEQ